MNKTALIEFQDALIVRSIVARVAMEHSSPSEMKQYLHDHPGADPKDHHVKKQEGGGGAGKSKGDLDEGPAQAEGKKAEARMEDVKKSYSEMRDLKKKVDDGNPVAKKKFERAYDKLLESGEKSHASAMKLLDKYGDAAKNMSGKEKKGMESALEALGNAASRWGLQKHRHHSAKYTEDKMDMAPNTYGAAQEIDAMVKVFHKAMKDPDQEIDTSWTKH